ncbi:MAG: hemolysin III family protein [Nitratireductor sp.]|nr:hemolysin III family protein [Nitratireductor sp.]
MKGIAREISANERMADAIVHGVGIGSSLIAVPLLLAIAIPRVSMGTGISLAIYGVAIITLFTVSAAYHLVPHLDWKPVLKRFDQAAIFIKIAGTYTPLAVILGSIFAYAVLAVVWVAALAGAIAKLALGPRFERISVALYLPLGWASLLLVWPIFATLPLAISILIVTGGIIYTVGVVFHMWESLAFQNAIWHACVLVASACHFAAVSGAAFVA